MDLDISIQEAYKTSKNYQDLVKKLIRLGIESYTVDVGSSIILYRLAEGSNVIHQGNIEPRSITLNFNEQLTIQAIRDTQQGKSDYPTFMNAIAKAGVRFYEATLIGSNKRVTYIGKGGLYEEQIPI